MIVTKNWLNEWIDLSNISTEELCLSLNKIGLEVSSVVSYKMPEHCVVGFVEEKLVHPNADKLSVCKVNIGTKVIQIVCGAKNIEKGQFVPVALVGSILPSGLKIEPAKLRDVESNGMICSSVELGLPKTNDGIMILGDKESRLKSGTPLVDIKDLNDDSIELELTPNRGDCLSIYGVARDLSVAFDVKINSQKTEEDDNTQIGIGRVLDIAIKNKIDASLIYKVLNTKGLKSNNKVDFRLAIIGSSAQTNIDKILAYVTHTTGVILRAYKADIFLQNTDERINIILNKESNGLDAVWGEKLISYIGIFQEKDSRATDSDEIIIIEASYVNPTEIAKNGARNIKNSDALLHNALRGSEPNLEFGINFLDYILNATSKVGILTGTQQIIKEREPKRININFENISEIIGQEIPKNDIVSTLQKLHFTVLASYDLNTFTVEVPSFRHDIENMQDICEEIVRVIGIDNIISKPLIFAEKNRMNDAYYNFEKRKLYRHKAAAAGFFESIHYIFDNRAKMEEFEIECIDKKTDLLNPITVELNTLRTTLVLGLLEAASKNKNAGKSSIKLFEVGIVFDKVKNESAKITFLISGSSSPSSVINHGKPKDISFFTFANKVSSVIGDFEIKKAEVKNKIFSPYEYGELSVESKTIGVIGRVHPDVENRYDLEKTYLCEIEFEKLFYGRKIASTYSRLPRVTRDLSLLVQKDISFTNIKECIEQMGEKLLQNFYPIDVYEDESLGDKKSLTIALIFQPEKKTFEDDEINKMVEKILKVLHEKLGVDIR